MKQAWVAASAAAFLAAAFIPSSADARSGGMGGGGIGGGAMVRGAPAGAIRGVQRAPVQHRHAHGGKQGRNAHAYTGKHHGKRHGNAHISRAMQPPVTSQGARIEVRRHVDGRGHSHRHFRNGGAFASGLAPFDPGYPYNSCYEWTQVRTPLGLRGMWVNVCDY